MVADGKMSVFPQLPEQHFPPDYRHNLDQESVVVLPPATVCRTPFRPEGVVISKLQWDLPKCKS